MRGPSSTTHGVLGCSSFGALSSPSTVWNRALLCDQGCRRIHGAMLVKGGSVLVNRASRRKRAERIYVVQSDDRLIIARARRDRGAGGQLAGITQTSGHGRLRLGPPTPGLPARSNSRPGCSRRRQRRGCGSRQQGHCEPADGAAVRREGTWSLGLAPLRPPSPRREPSVRRTARRSAPLGSAPPARCSPPRSVLRSSAHRRRWRWMPVADSPPLRRFGKRP